MNRNTFRNIIANEFIRFSIVGIIATIVDAAIFYLVGMCAPYQVALVSGYMISLVINYILTVSWTFRTKHSIKSLFGFIAAHLFNLFVVRMGLMYLFVDILLINDRIAYIPTLVISVITNYIIVRYIVKKCSV